MAKGQARMIIINYFLRDALKESRIRQPPQALLPALPSIPLGYMRVYCKEIGGGRYQGLHRNDFEMCP